MRKFFLFGCASLVALASAAVTIDVTPRLKTSYSVKGSRTAGESKTLTSRTISESETSTLPVLKATRASEGEGVEGLWNFELGDYYDDETASGIITVLYEATYGRDDLVLFKDPSNNYPAFAGRYEAGSNEVTFSREMLSSQPGIYFVQEPIHWNTQTKDFDFIEQFSGTFNRAEGTLTFLSDVGIMWSVYVDNGRDVEWTGFLYVYDFVRATKLGDLEASWTDVGQALFMDGWLLPGFGFDQTDPANQYNVPIQQNVFNTNIFRLVDPYHVGPMAPYNQTDRKGYIQFDVSDPKHVVFSRAEAGFANRSEEIEQFYCYNMLGSLLQDYPGYTGPELARLLGNQIPYTTYVDGVVSLNYLVEEDAITYDVNFGTQDRPSGGYIWMENDNTKSYMIASITLPEMNGIESVGYAEDAVEEYYDLTGRRLTTPAPGQIIIVRKGSKAEKRVF